MRTNPSGRQRNRNRETVLRFVIEPIRTIYDSYCQPQRLAAPANVLPHLEDRRCWSASSVRNLASQVSM